MLSHEERRGLWFTLIGGGALALALLVWLGFFRDRAAPLPPAAAATPRAPVVRLGSVHGRLVDSRRALGIADRTVEVLGIAGRSDHYLAPASTRHPGSFEVRALPEGPVTLALGADGYVTASRTVEVRAGVALDLGVVELTPLARLAGRVVDAAGTAIAPPQSAVVLSANGRELARAAIDDHGAFRFERLAPDRYQLDLAPLATGETLLAPLEVDATAGGDQPLLEPVAVPTCTLVGRLQLPIGSAPARAIACGDRRGAVTGDGRFTLPDLRAGPLLAHVELDAERTVEFAACMPCDAVEWSVDSPAALSSWPATSHRERVALERALAPFPTFGAGPLVGDGELRVRLRCGESNSGPAWLRFAATSAPDGWFTEAYTTRDGAARVQGLPVGVALRVEAWSGAWRGSGEIRLEAGVPGELRLALVEETP